MVRFIVDRSIVGVYIKAIKKIMQANDLNLETQKLLAREKSYERKADELRQVSNDITDFAAHICKLNIYDKLHVLPISESDFSDRKAKYNDLYTFCEANYTKVFVSKLLHDYCDACVHVVGISKEQQELLIAQKGLAEAYRRLYCKVLDFINFIIPTLGTLYHINSLGVWEIEQRYSDNLKASSDISYEEFDETKPWKHHLGKRVNIPDTPKKSHHISETGHYASLKQSITERSLIASKEEEKYFAEFNDMLLELRHALVVYIGAKEAFDLQVLLGEIEPNTCGNDHLALFVSQRNK